MACGGAQVRLPRLEHTCSSLFPRCIGNQCLLRIDIVYPKSVHSDPTTRSASGLHTNMGFPYSIPVTWSPYAHRVCSV